MPNYDFNKPSKTAKDLFSAPSEVPGYAAKDTNSKLQVRMEDEPDVEKTAGALFAEAPADDMGPDYGHRKFRLRKSEEVSVYSEQMDRRYDMDARGKKMIVLGVALLLALVVGLVLPAGFFGLGKTATWASFLSTAAGNIQGLLDYFSGAGPYDPMRYKFCSYLIIAIAGASLGISGGVYQGALKNALASPTTLGVISGGSLGMMLYVVFCTDDQAQTITFTAQEAIEYFESLSLTEYMATVYGPAFFSLVGCFVVVAFVLLVSKLAGRGKMSGVALIISGQVVGIVISSVMTLIRTYFSSSEGSTIKAMALQSIRSNAFSKLYTEIDLVLVGIPVLLGLVVVIALRLRLNALTFSEDEARSMGLSTGRTRTAMVGACTLMTAVIVSFCGSIGFVGFVVPHLTRRIVGPNFRYYIPATALAGALFMTIVYFLSSFAGLADFGGVRIFTSVIGGISFIVVALRNRNRMTADGF